MRHRPIPPKLRFVFVTLSFWLLLAVSRAGLLRVFPAGGDAGDLYLSFAFVLLLICSVLCALLLGDSLPRNFLVIALLVGVFYVVVTKFAYCTDEGYHFQRAFGIANGEFMPRMLDGKVGLHIPKGYEHYSQQETWSLANFFQSEELSSPVGKLVFLPRVRAASYLPLCYLPNAVGVVIGSVLQLPLAAVVALGRLTGYLAYVLLCWLAIRRVKRFQTVLFLTALIPTSLELAGTFNIDGMLIGSSLLFLSICLHYSFDETEGRMKTSDLVLLVVSAAFLLSAKYLGYAALLLLAFFLPKQRLSNKREVVAAMLLTIVLVLVAQLWAVLAYRGSLDDAPVKGANVQEQLQFILAHPASFLKTLALDFMPNIITRLHFFIETGTMSLNFIAEPLALLPIAGAILAKDKPALETRQAINWAALWMFIAVFSVLVSASALYLSFTPVGAEFVNGMQNRYVLPVVALSYLTLSLIPVENRIKSWERSLSLLAAIAVINIIAGRIIDLMTL